MPDNILLIFPTLQVSGPVVDSSPVLMRVCAVIEGSLPMRPGGVNQTYADVTGRMNHFGFKPLTALGEGFERFAGWHTRSCRT